MATSEIKRLTRNHIAANITSRLDKEITSRSNQLYPMKEIDPSLYMDVLLSVVYLYTRPKKGTRDKLIFFSEVASSIGHRVRGFLKMKMDTSVATRLGAFLLYTFEDFGVLHIKLTKGSNGHNVYVVEVLKDDVITDFWSKIPRGMISKTPAAEPYEDWTSSRHSSGQSLVKTGDKEVLSSLTPTTHPIVYNCVNKAQRVGWNINNQVLSLVGWALKNRVDAFAEIWEQRNKDARATKLREAQAIKGMADKLKGTTFYHLYYYDFRGRKYPTTAYLHEQGSDLSRGLLLRQDVKPVGREGFFWLMVSLASNWGGDSGREDGLKTDKISIKERHEWALANEDVFLSYAENPKTEMDWMSADKPWQFIAACLELKKLREWQYLSARGFECYDYPSGLEVYIDGSNNGSQHLTALTRDEITAPHVNLVPQVRMGDLYRYVADSLWKHIDETLLTHDEASKLEAAGLVDDIISLKEEVNRLDYEDPQRTELITKLQSLRLIANDLGDLPPLVYWSRFKDQKSRRKIVKRNTMTLPYGGTPYGLGQQQIDDAKKHGIDKLLVMEHKWGAFLGRLIFNDCKISLERPMRLLQIFEAAGAKAESEGRFLKWKLPITNFPVTQHYTEGTVKKLWIQYGPKIGEHATTKHDVNELQIAVCFIEDTKPSKGKQSQGASPNVIHSLDAAHLMLVVDAADFPVTTIHDSYGCLLADMPELFKIVRTQFLRLYQHNPIDQIMIDIGGDMSSIEMGSLDISQILESEFCFV